MILQEPKVEFVPIDENVFAQAESACPDYQSSTPVGGGQRCFASQEDAQGCEDFDSTIPWLT